MGPFPTQTVPSEIPVSPGDRREPYTTIRLNDLNDVSYVTAECLLGEVAFDSEEEMKRLATEGKTFFASQVAVIESGTLDGVALYFEAVLCRGGVRGFGEEEEEELSEHVDKATLNEKSPKRDNYNAKDPVKNEDITISTRPCEGVEACWEQAVYAPLTTVASESDVAGNVNHIRVKQGQKLSFAFRLDDDILWLRDVRSHEGEEENGEREEEEEEKANYFDASSPILIKKSSISMSKLDRVEEAPLLDSFLVSWMNLSDSIRRRYRDAVLKIITSKLQNGSVEPLSTSTTTATSTSTSSSTTTSPATIRILEKTEGLPIVGLEVWKQLAKSHPFVFLELIIVEDDEEEEEEEEEDESNRSRALKAILASELADCEMNAPKVTIAKTRDLRSMEGKSVDVVVLDVVDKIGK